ncbi:MAG: hypothetical protein U0R50_01605 [Gaiellales bacterium]
MRAALRDFWAWYERHYTLNVGIAAGLFVVQLVHLFWLTVDPFWALVFGDPLLVIEKPWSWPVLLVDYTEVPALLSVSLVYVNELRTSGRSLRPIAYLVFLNSQWLHIFWITDAFVVESGTNGGASTLPIWLAYVAIMIDYLELPVIYDTFRKLGRSMRERRLETLEDVT